MPKLKITMDSRVKCPALGGLLVPTSSCVRSPENKCDCYEDVAGGLRGSLHLYCSYQRKHKLTFGFGKSRTGRDVEIEAPQYDEGIIAMLRQTGQMTPELEKKIGKGRGRK